jgi:hypothetical protein
MAAGDRVYWRGGAFQRGAATAVLADDGNFNFDHNGTDYSESNWLSSAGVGRIQPADDEIPCFGQFAAIAPSDYSEATTETEADGHYCCDTNLDQDDMDFGGLEISRVFNANVSGYNSDLCDAAAVVTDGGGARTKIKITGHTMLKGAWATIAGTTSQNGEWLIYAIETDWITIVKPFVAETLLATASVVARFPLTFTTKSGSGYTGRVVVESNGINYLACGDNNTDGDNILGLDFRSETGILKLSNDNYSAAGNEGNWDDILVLGAGTLEVFDNAFITKIIMPGDVTNATVIVGKGVAEMTSGDSVILEVAAGNITIDSPIGPSVISGGVITYCPNVDLATTVDIDDIKGYGGEFNWWGKGSLKDFYWLAGTLTAYGDGDKVIGSAASSYTQAGGTIDLSQAGGEITQYASSDIDRRGGVFHTPLRTNLTW